VAAQLHLAIIMVFGLLMWHMDPAAAAAAATAPDLGSTPPWPQYQPLPPSQQQQLQQVVVRRCVPCWLQQCPGWGSPCAHQHWAVLLLLLLLLVVGQGRCGWMNSGERWMIREM
jgi:hypothetical protein